MWLCLPVRTTARRRCAYPVGAKRLVEAKPFSSERVDIGRLGKRGHDRILICPNRRCRVIIRIDKYDIGPCCLNRRLFNDVRDEHVAPCVRLTAGQPKRERKPGADSKCVSHVVWILLYRLLLAGQSLFEPIQHRCRRPRNRPAPRWTLMRTPLRQRRAQSNRLGTRHSALGP